LGTALNSGRSIFLYGPTGTGKTTIAAKLGGVFAQDRVWIPHAVEVDGQIIGVYDPLVHKAVHEPVPADFDRRWVLCERPLVLVGGELTIEMLDLQFDSVTKFYVGPLQMKANNGMLIVDDFGRQRIKPDQLLNRWVVPLDRKVDYLSIAGGRKIEIPFDIFVVFATNLNPSELVEAAFLRRIQTKIKIDPVSDPQFHEIFRRVCKEFDLEYDEALVNEVIEFINARAREPLRPCFPRDLANQIVWASRYQNQAARLNKGTISAALSAYFVSD